LFPFSAIVEGRALKVAGIGAVATHPEFRGRGLMKRLMDHLMGEITKEGFDLAILWGERNLYRPFGFERALNLEKFTLGPSSLPEKPPPPGLRNFQPKDERSLIRLFSSQLYHTKKGHFQSLERRFGGSGHRAIWVLEKKGRIASYGIFLKAVSGVMEIAEWGGNREDLLDLFAGAIRKLEGKGVTLSLEATSPLYGWALENYLERVKGSGSCMVKPLNLGKLLWAFEPQMNRSFLSQRLKTPGSWTLQMGDSTVATLQLKGGLQVLPGAARGRRILGTPPQITRLLWGMGRPSETSGMSLEDFEWADLLFPLHWQWWRSDWI
jgi:hypothetical protein